LGADRRQRRPVAASWTALLPVALGRVVARPPRLPSPWRSPVIVPILGGNREMGRLTMTSVEVDLRSLITVSSLLPDAVEEMLDTRMGWQVMRFRTTCTDCVPNY
jgi:hypothetical protein